MGVVIHIEKVFERLVSISSELTDLSQKVDNAIKGIEEENKRIGTLEMLMKKSEERHPNNIHILAGAKTLKEVFTLNARNLANFDNLLKQKMSYATLSDTSSAFLLLKNVEETLPPGVSGWEL
ncbi:MAG: hypothetical protein IPJ82_13195 [Lewinellaceae bacterium]|nr:hypothetical protein [Lewinellaceae bacterium]